MPSNTTEYAKLHYLHNKRMITDCGCGSKYSKPNEKKHFATKRHTDFINGVVKEPIQPIIPEEDIEVACVNCGHFVSKSKMDLHLISVKCKKTVKLINNLQFNDIDALDKYIQDKLNMASFGRMF